MKEVKLKIKRKIDDSYQIYIAEDTTSKLIDFIKSNYGSARVCIISDKKVAKLIAEDLGKKLKRKGIKNAIISFASGEKNKNLNTVEQLCEKMIKEGFNRKDIVLALGGGVAGDIAGFVAAIFMRGIPFIQVPTSLLAMVDSSIGGKTGVDLKSGKNLVGAFHQPKGVFISIDYLKKLPNSEFNNGMAEIIKHGIIQDKSYFKWIEKNKEKISSLDSNTLIKLIRKSCLIKKNVVEKDEKEAGLRMILNYGHTIGHALEQLSNYKLKHGEAISIGMIKENNLSSRLEEKHKERIKKLFEFFNLPIQHELCKESKKLIEIMSNDKKNTGKNPRFAIPIKIGKTEIKEFKRNEIVKALK